MLMLNGIISYVLFCSGPALQLLVEEEKIKAFLLGRWDKKLMMGAQTLCTVLSRLHGTLSK